MKRALTTWLAMGVLATTAGCTTAQIAQLQQIADAYLATVALQTTDETGAVRSVSQSEVASVELDGQTVPATFDSQGELQLPGAGDGRERLVRVRLRDGSVVEMRLNRQAGFQEGNRLRYVGNLQRQGGRLIAADVLPGGAAPETVRVAQLRRQYVVIRINRPGLAGRLRARGIDRVRLPQDAFFVSAAGDLLVNRAVLRRFARPGSKLWAVVALGGGGAVSQVPGLRPRTLQAMGPRHVLFVLRLNTLPTLSPPPVPAASGAIVSEPPAETEAVLNAGADVTVEADETTGPAVANPDAYAGETVAPEPAPSASPAPAASASPVASDAGAAPSPSVSASAAV